MKYKYPIVWEALFVLKTHLYDFEMCSIETKALQVGENLHVFSSISFIWVFL